MAVIHLGRDTVLDRPVAVKLLAERYLDDRDLRERFLREGRFAARLSHPNVVAVFDTGEEEGRPYIVLEYVEGGSLADELGARERLSAGEVLEVGRQAAVGLAHAHEAGVVHRDVKPANLMVRSDGTVKIADFGIARAAGSGTITEAGTLFGTVEYMAPEVADGKEATAASDLYSLGAVLYELLTGRPPRSIRTLADLAAATTIVEPRELVADPPAQLVEVIRRCLEPDPKRRPASANEIAIALGGEDAPTRVLAPTLRVRRTRPRGTLWIALAAVLVGVLAVLGLTLGDGDEEPPGAPPPVEPVRAGDGPAENARNLSDWLRSNSR